MVSLVWRNTTSPFTCNTVGRQYCLMVPILFLFSLLVPACLPLSLSHRLSAIKSKFAPLSTDVALQTLLNISASFPYRDNLYQPPETSPLNFLIPSIDWPSPLPDPLHLQAPPTPVPGCTSLLTMTLTPGHISTASDSRITAAIAHVLASCLTGADEGEILSLDPSSVSGEMGMSSFLSPGRNDGVASMVRTAQASARGERPAEVAREEDIAVLLSGGVDSSVALSMLLEQGYRPRCFYLKIWLEDELAHLGECPWEDDFEVCRGVCERLGVGLEAVGLQSEYRDQVIEYTVGEAGMGRTPNPDIMCNSRVKFGVFLDYAKSRGFSKVATGHYARVEEIGGSFRLRRAPDPVKDQSYFLCGLSQEQLGMAVFPIGHLKKEEVRRLAERFDLPNKNRPDSQGLCFLGKVKFDDFIGNYLGSNPGDCIDAGTGEIIGRHNGLWFHTCGQRKGLGAVLDVKKNSQGPWYVVRKDVAGNKLLVSNEYNDEDFEEVRKKFKVENIRWIGEGLAGMLIMKIRHGPTIVAGNLSLDPFDPTRGSVELDEKDGGLAPGQWVAFYDNGDICLGAAIIADTPVRAGT